MIIDLGAVFFTSVSIVSRPRTSRFWIDAHVMVATAVCCLPPPNRPQLVITIDIPKPPGFLDASERRNAMDWPCRRYWLHSEMPLSTRYRLARDSMSFSLQVGMSEYIAATRSPPLSDPAKGKLRQLSVCRRATDRPTSRASKIDSFDNAPPDGARPDMRLPSSVTAGQ